MLPLDFIGADNEIFMCELVLSIGLFLDEIVSDFCDEGLGVDAIHGDMKSLAWMRDEVMISIFWNWIFE